MFRHAPHPPPWAALVAACAHTSSPIAYWRPPAHACHRELRPELQAAVLWCDCVFNGVSGSPVVCRAISTQCTMP